MKLIGLLVVTVFINSCSLEKNPPTNFSLSNTVEITSSNDKQILSLCDVGDNPSEFDGKMIRLKSQINFGIENSTFLDNQCSYSAVVSFANENAYQPIDKMRKEGSRSKETLFYADVEVEGKFINQPFTRCCTKTPFQFEITKTLKAQPVNRK